MDLSQISPRDLAVRLRCESAPLVLDVREKWELELAKIEGTVDVPMTQVPENLDRLRKEQGERDLVVMCHGGKRSSIIVNYLLQNGFDRVINLDGGIHAWAQEVDQNVPTY